MLFRSAIGGVSRFDASYGTTFVISFALCGTLEYLASYFMEKRFHARWWDYSSKPMNLNGRVWIGNLILFGLAGVLVVNVANPVLYGLLDRVRPVVRRAAAGGLSAVFAADYVVSHLVMKLVKAGVEDSQADSTEQISREIRLLLSDRSIFYRRFSDAYPEVIYRTERISRRMEQVRAETERLRREAERHRRGEPAHRGGQGAAGRVAGDLHVHPQFHHTEPAGADRPAVRRICRHGRDEAPARRHPAQHGADRKSVV